MSASRIGILGFFFLLVAAPGALPAVPQGDFLSEEEGDKLRETQDPTKRVEVYLEFAQARLARFEGFRRKPVDPRYDNASYLNDLLGQYIYLNDELKNWIDYQFQHQGDMRSGLRELLVRGREQLEELRRNQQRSDAYTAEVGASLRDAVDQVQDMLEGATRALTEQQKTLPEIKRDEKAATRLSKERLKEEEKRTKEERKMRKTKRGVPADPDLD